MPGIAERTLEVYITATLEAQLQPPARAGARLAPDHGSTSRGGRAELPAQPSAATPRFLDYFKSATPLEELGGLNIGSRPARRKALAGIASLRAIPWVFAWTQTRLMLPSWLGFDRALQVARDQGQVPELQRMYQEWPFFRSCLSLIEMVLAKADRGIAARYDERLVTRCVKAAGLPAARTPSGG